jgi:hypothetical protein
LIAFLHAGTLHWVALRRFALFMHIFASCELILP